MMNAGLNPVIFLVPRHAFPGLIIDNHYVAIEAIGIGGEGLGKIIFADEAIQVGLVNTQRFFQNAQSEDGGYKTLRIRDLVAKGVLPMELKDDVFSDKKQMKSPKLLFQIII
jgi:hypothetical protein